MPPIYSATTRLNIEPQKTWGSTDSIPHGRDDGFAGGDARKAMNLMAHSLSEESDKADRPQSLVPSGCGKIVRLRRCAPHQGE